MAMVKIDETHYTNIANAIRSVNKTTNTYRPSEMANAIAQLSSGAEDGLIDLLQNRATVKTLSLPQATVIGSYGLAGCKYVTTLNIPNVTRIESYGLCQCERLKTLDLPNVTYIGSSALEKCTNLQTIILGSDTVCDVPYNFNSTFGTQSTSSYLYQHTAYIYVPADLVDAYKADSRWSAWADNILPILE